MKKIIVLGSKGFIGSNALKFLLGRGFDVVGVDDDIREKKLIERHFLKSSVILNCAGETKSTNSYQKCFSTNVDGTKNVVELCIKHECPLVHLSSTTRYTPYGRSKQVSQIYVEEAFTRGLKGIILRLCPIVTLDSPLMVEGRRYPIEKLVKDLAEILEKERFNGEVLDYKNKI